MIGLRRIRREQHGASTVEFAIVVPVFMMLVCGIIDMGRAFYTLSQVDGAVREAARTAAVMLDPTEAGAADSVRSVAVNFGAPMGNAALSKSQVDVNVDTVANTVTVRIHDDSLSLITPLGRMIGMPAVVLTRSATLPLEHTS